MRWVQCDNIKFWQSIFTVSQHSHQICIWFAAGCIICRGTRVLVTRQQCLRFNMRNVLACDCNIYSARTNFRNLLHQHEEKSSYQYMSTNSFRSTDPQCVDLNPLDFYLWGHLKTLVCSAPIENEETFTSVLQMSSNHSPLPQDLWKCARGPRSDMFISTMIHVEDILSICCTLWLNNQ